MPRQSRGCPECRRRRIGCDGSQPACQNCQKYNRRCSGAVQGHPIIDQTNEIKSRYARWIAHAETHGSPAITQPSHMTILSTALQAALFHYVSSTADTPSRPTWLGQLQALPQAQKGLALDLSLQAVAMAYYGLRSKTNFAVQQACAMYGRALSLHSQSVSQLSKIPTPSMIYTSVVLSLFEAMLSLDDEAYSKHLNAAQNMLSLTRNDTSNRQSHDELLRQMYIHIQYQSLFLLITAPTECLTSGELARKGNAIALWNELETSETVVDNLLAVLFKLGKIISTNSFDENDVSNDLPELQEIDSRIRILWDNYTSEATRKGETLKYEHGGIKQYQDASTAWILAYFACANILLHLAGFWPATQSFRIMEEHCQQIIDCGLFLERKRHVFGCARFPLLFPITLVAKYSTSVPQRTVASILVGSRLQCAAFSGLATIANRTLNFATLEHQT